MSSARPSRQPLRPAPRRRPLVAAASASAAALLLGAAAASAVAAPGSAEVVSRASGAAGAAPLTFNPRSTGVISSDGRYSIFSGNTKPPSDSFEMSLYLRDIVRNVTTEVVGPGISMATGIDRANRLVSVITDQSLLPVDTDAEPDVYVIDRATGKRTLAGRATGVNGAEAFSTDGIVSGDGRSVVFSGDVPGVGPGLFRRDLRTAETTKIGDPLNGETGERLYSVSDDGRTVGTQSAGDGQGDIGTLITPTTRIATGGAVKVSADGSTAAWFRRQPSTPSAGELVVRTLSTGAETVTAAPSPATANDFFVVDNASVLWIAPDGSQVGVTPGHLVWSASVAPPLLYTRATNSFAAIPNTFAPGLRASSRLPQAAISRTGRFALVSGSIPFRGFFAVDLFEQGLPGGADAAPAAEYIGFANVTCDETAPGRYRYSVPGLRNPEWVEAARSVKLSLTIDGAAVGDNAGSARSANPELSLSGLTIAPDATVAISADVITASGKRINGTYVDQAASRPDC